MKKDTSPMVPSVRHKQTVRIEEKNDIATFFDTTVEYPSDDLPEWFQPLQAIVEDRTFTDMVINLGEGVHYLISIAKEEDKEHEQDPVSWEYKEGCTCGICYRHKQLGDGDDMGAGAFDAIAYGENSEPDYEGLQRQADDMGAEKLALSWQRVTRTE